MDPGCANSKTHSIQKPDNQAVRIIQFTDVHFLDDPTAKFYGCDPKANFANVIALAKQEDGCPDAFIVTGDLVQTETASAYQQLQPLLQDLETPVYCLPGNHDVPILMERHLLGDNIHMIDRLRVGGWDILFMNTYVAEATGGYLSHSELNKLAAFLSNQNCTHAMVCMHHPPVSIGSRWLDEIGLDNADAFFEIVDQHPQVELIVMGHIHQTFSLQRKHATILATPSTCMQFKPHCERFAQDDAAPGYRCIDLLPNGMFNTKVRRLVID